jgi:hypothetical protein
LFAILPLVLMAEDGDSGSFTVVQLLSVKLNWDNPVAVAMALIQFARVLDAASQRLAPPRPLVARGPPMQVAPDRVSKLAELLAGLRTIAKASTVRLRKHGPSSSDGPAAACALGRGALSDTDVEEVLRECGLQVQGARVLSARDTRRQAVARVPALGAVAKVCVGSAREADAYGWLYDHAVPGVLYPLAVHRLARGGTVLLLPQLNDCLSVRFNHENDVAQALTPVIEVRACVCFLFLVVGPHTRGTDGVHACAGPGGAARARPGALRRQGGQSAAGRHALAVPADRLRVPGAHRRACRGLHARVCAA